MIVKENGQESKSIQILDAMFDSGLSLIGKNVADLSVAI